MKKNPVLMDGAVGTTLWAMAESRGIAKVPVWQYNIEQPELVIELARAYIEAGSQMILSNTFSANGPAVRREGAYSTHDVVYKGVQLAREAAAGTDVKVALAVGPLTMLLEPFGDLTPEEAIEIYEEQIGAGMEAGPDCIALMTFMDLEMMKLAAQVAKRYSVPVFCTMSFQQGGRTLMGNSVQDIIDGLTPLQVDVLGINCSMGPDEALPVIREFFEKTDLPLMFKPNAGKPLLNEDGTVLSSYNSSRFVEDIAPALVFVDYVGGCCGSDVSYIHALKQRLSE